MLGKIFGVICAIAVVFAIFGNALPELGGAVMDGARGAVTLSVALLGMNCLWCGILRVMSEAGVLTRLSRMVTPLIKVFFPDTYKSGIGREEICANVAANLLGIGNAATPAALSAMEKMQSQNPTPERASRDMITLAVLNTSSIAILPTTILTLLRSSGAIDPFRILMPIWICSSVCSLLALTLCRVFGEIYKKREERRGRRLIKKNEGA